MASEGKNNMDPFKETEGEILPEKFNYKKSMVAIVKLDNYRPEEVCRALKEILNLLNINDYFKDKSILLKPNMLAPTNHSFTPIVIITELMKLIKDDAKSILVGDSSLTKGITAAVIKRTKIKEQVEELGGEVFNFFEQKRTKITIKNPIHEAQESLYLPEDIINSDIIINLPKLKTHNGFVYTGAIKNFFGLLGNKMKMHMIHKNKADFQKMLGDIYFATEETNNTDLPKVLTIMDAVIAMEGKGPRAGKPRDVGVLVAGFNFAAVDMIGYALMNGNPEDLEAIKTVARRTDLPLDISKLDIVGQKDYKQFIVKDFKKPSIAMFKGALVPESGLWAKIENKMTSISIKINKKKCILCEQCIKHCPAEAMVRKKDRIYIDQEACVECFCCGESCNNDAISTKWYLFRVMPLLIIMIGLLGLGAVLGIIFLIQFIFSFF